MHTSLRVTRVLSGVQSSVVLGLGFRGWAAFHHHARDSFFHLDGYPRPADGGELGGYRPLQLGDVKKRQNADPAKPRGNRIS